MKKRNKYIITFSLSFLVCVCFFILMRKFFTSKGIGPLNWQEIYDNLFSYMVPSLIFAIIMTIRAYFGMDDK